MNNYMLLIICAAIFLTFSCEESNKAQVIILNEDRSKLKVVGEDAEFELFLRVHGDFLSISFINSHDQGFSYNSRNDYAKGTQITLYDEKKFHMYNAENNEIITSEKPLSNSLGTDTLSGGKLDE